VTSASLSAPKQVLSLSTDPPAACPSTRCRIWKPLWLIRGPGEHRLLCPPTGPESAPFGVNFQFVSINVKSTNSRTSSCALDRDRRRRASIRKTSLNPVVGFTSSGQQKSIDQSLNRSKTSVSLQYACVTFRTLRPALSDDFVERLWLFSDAPPHSKERIVPSGTVELVINLHEDAVRIYDSAQPHCCKRFSGAVVSGP
jgi:hypothetical protein